MILIPAIIPSTQVTDLPALFSGGWRSEELEPIEMIVTDLPGPSHCLKHSNTQPPGITSHITQQYTATWDNS